VGLFRSQASLCLENLALRHQLAVYKQTVHRPRLRLPDRLFWVWLSRLWSGCQATLAFVQPRTVIAWQRQRFRDHWRRLSQQGRPGRPAVAKEILALIQDMWQATPTWGSPRIVGELRKLGIDVAKSTVETYRVRPRRSPSPTWKVFLNNHVRDFVSMDFFVVPTVTHTVLFVLLILVHERRGVVHVNITEHPTAEWTAQQVVDAFPWDNAPRYLLRDRDRIYSASFRQRVRHMGIEEVVIAPRSPWQNPYVERIIGSIRRECLDHVVVLHQRHR
jgi:transposase InsO family protein